MDLVYVPTPPRDVEARHTENSTSRGTPPLLSLFKAELDFVFGDYIYMSVEYVSFSRPAKRERVTPIACNDLPSWIKFSQEGAEKPRCVSVGAYLHDCRYRRVKVLGFAGRDRVRKVQ